jgi:exopolyphosphatase / guanosine-5'-triphosphate,3'-diphosphate pyrophosphatase
MATDPRKERRAGARDANAPHAKRQSTAAATVEQAHRLVARITGALGATADPPSRMRRMRVAVVDVGANTLRLLVAETDARGGFVPIREERRRTGLGEDVERRGRLTREKIERSAEAARKEVRRARKLGAMRIEVVVTSPWRSAENGRELIAALEQATGLRVQPLSEEDEAEHGFVGALSRTQVDAEPVAVCDVGGGSTQIAVGTASAPSWLRSVPLGSLRLTERCLVSDPPTRLELATARTEVAAAFSELTPPLPAVALATGGTARALRRHGLRRLGEDALESAIEELTALSIVARAKRAKVDLERARTLPAGAIILAELQRVLQVPLGVADGGVREGVCTQLLEVEAATA